MDHHRHCKWKFWFDLEMYAGCHHRPGMHAAKRLDQYVNHHLRRAGASLSHNGPVR
jgi:hypothetical protein